MSKTIFFILDSFNLYDFKKLYNNLEYICCYSYFDTEEAINNNIPNIITYDIGHLSFDLEDLGYKIFIGYNGKYVHFTVGMSTTNGKELRHGHNLRRLLIGGALDNDLGIEKNKFWYDTTISTSELCKEEYNRQQSYMNLALKVAQKTIGLNLSERIKAMTPEESKEWHETHAYYDKDGGFWISGEPVEYDGVNKIKPNFKIIGNTLCG